MRDNEKILDKAVSGFRKILAEQLLRVESLKSEWDFIDYSTLDKIVIGVIGGDGIGPVITSEAERILRFVLDDLILVGRVEIRKIDGLTLENRIAKKCAIPEDVMKEIKACHVILKGPTTTPQKGDGTPNIESANVRMRMELDLFANVRPVKIPKEGVNWVIFRENTEGSYAVGSSGIDVTEDLSVDFTVTTRQGTERIARAAYEYARKNKFGRVSLVTKANVIKTTDGNFLEECKRVAKEYPEILTDEWYADIMAAKLADKKRRRDFGVLLMPNLYGDIISDEAAEFQGGVGTAGSANIGKRYAMFEAIHGSAPRMIREGRADFADPSSMLRAAVMLLAHVGLIERAEKLDRALDICIFEERRITVTGRCDGACCREFGDYVIKAFERLG